ncbi:SURF1 family protein [Vibrio paucivorans]|uniref:SURF1-like protein n=1 Tax=Vibrio paucivorans TaxID=2829489 RepID=A0A9X3CB11_9VIBR|nr:SURF1 family protein [Vibrio paucivorans]MCW8332393.1 SURF1 family protein [Vibrio paucivorans]
MLKTKQFWFGLIVTVVVFSVLVKLGFWQLARGEDKQTMEVQLANYQSKPAIPLAEFLRIQQGRQNGSVSLDLAGMKIWAELEPIPNAYVYLDNQTYRAEPNGPSKVGYLALQVMRSRSGQYLLVERGFIAAMRDRRTLPTISWLDTPHKLEGRVYTRSHNPLSSDIQSEFMQGIYRIQNLNIEQLSTLFGVPLAAYVLQPQQDDWPYSQPWKPVPMKSTKHYGYAFQWFSMALALCILSSWVTYKYLKRITRDQQGERQ